MSDDLFTNILRHFARCVTGSRLEHCCRLLGARWMYPQFLQTLQQYAVIMNRQQDVDPRIFAIAIMDSFEHFSTVVGHDFSMHLLCNMLDVTQEDLTQRRLN